MYKNLFQIGVTQCCHNNEKFQFNFNKFLHVLDRLKKHQFKVRCHSNLAKLQVPTSDKAVVRGFHHGPLQWPGPLWVGCWGIGYLIHPEWTPYPLTWSYLQKCKNRNFFPYKEFQKNIITSYSYRRQKNIDFDDVLLYLVCKNINKQLMKICI